jgi:hypothetical protein
MLCYTSSGTVFSRVRNTHVRLGVACIISFILQTYRIEIMRAIPRRMLFEERLCVLSLWGMENLCHGGRNGRTVHPVRHGTTLSATARQKCMREGPGTRRRNSRGGAGSKMSIVYEVFFCTRHTRPKTCAFQPIRVDRRGNVRMY